MGFSAEKAFGKQKKSTKLKRADPRFGFYLQKSSTLDATFRLIERRIGIKIHNRTTLHSKTKLEFSQLAMRLAWYGSKIKKIKRSNINKCMERVSILRGGGD